MSRMHIFHTCLLTLRWHMILLLLLPPLLLVLMCTVRSARVISMRAWLTIVTSKNSCPRWTRESFGRARRILENEEKGLLLIGWNINFTSPSLSPNQHADCTDVTAFRRRTTFSLWGESESHSNTPLHFTSCQQTTTSYLLFSSLSTLLFLSLNQCFRLFLLSLLYLFIHLLSLSLDATSFHFPLHSSST